MLQYELTIDAARRQKRPVTIQKLAVDDNELPVTSRKFPEQPIKLAENGKNCQWKMASGLARGPLSRCDASLSFHHASHAFSCIHTRFYLPRHGCSCFLLWRRVPSHSSASHLLVAFCCRTCFSAFPPSVFHSTYGLSFPFRSYHPLLKTTQHTTSSFTHFLPTFLDFEFT